MIGLVNCAVTIKQNIERPADAVHPLLESGERSKRNNKDAGVEFCKFVLARAQLCGMFAAGYSTQVTKENEQYISVFENFAEHDLFTFNGLQGEVWSRRVLFEFQVSGSNYQVKLRFAQMRR